MVMILLNHFYVIFLLKTSTVTAVTMQRFVSCDVPSCSRVQI